MQMQIEAFADLIQFNVAIRSKESKNVWNQSKASLNRYFSDLSFATALPVMRCNVLVLPYCS